MLQIILHNFPGTVEPVDYQIAELVKLVGGVTAVILGLIWLFTIVARGVTSVQLARIQLEAARVKSIADDAASDNEIAKSLVHLLAKSSANQERTAQVLEAVLVKVDATASIASQATQHYATTDAFQEYAKPLLIGIKTTVDQTDLKVGELHTSKRDLVNQVVEVNKAVQHLNATLTEYLNRDSKPTPEPVSDSEAVKELLSKINTPKEPAAPAPESGEATVPEPPVNASETQADVVPMSAGDGV